MPLHSSSELIYEISLSLFTSSSSSIDDVRTIGIGPSSSSFRFAAPRASFGEREEMPVLSLSLSLSLSVCVCTEVRRKPTEERTQRRPRKRGESFGPKRQSGQREEREKSMDGWDFGRRWPREISNKNALFKLLLSVHGRNCTHLRPRKAYIGRRTCLTLAWRFQISISRSTRTQAILLSTHS